MCKKIKLHFWKCGHRIQKGIKVCKPWAERSQILDSNGKCPNDCVSVERYDEKCWNCAMGEIEEPTLSGLPDKPDSHLDRGETMEGGHQEG